MKKFFLLSLLIVVNHGLATSHTGKEFSAAIRWSDERLTWEDFQGVPNAASAGDAATAIRIKAEPFYRKKKLNYSIHADFIPSKSWYRFKTDALLGHEQLHFDLAELYARKARQKVAELQEKGENDIDVYNAEIQKILNESNDADRNYDRETLHGSLLKAQESWRFRTNVELTLLQEYRSR